MYLINNMYVSIIEQNECSVFLFVFRQYEVIKNDQKKMGEY